jgi:outer membrane protein
VDDRTLSGSAGLSKFFATGTKVALEGTTRLDDSSADADPYAATRGGVSVVQSLLKGAGESVNLASLRQARLDTRSTEYQLRGFAEALAARIENTYWAYALAQRQIDIYTDSLKLAEQQLAETRARIAVGKTAELELSAAEAEVASRQTGLINARSELDKTRIRFQNLLNPNGANAYLRDIALLDPLAMPRDPLDDVSNHVAVAMRMRPDLNETRLAIQRGDLEVVKTRNGLLPRLDLFVRLGSSGYADSFQPSARRVNGDFTDASAGLEFAYALGNNSAKAQHQRAALSREQDSEILANMQQLAEMDVRSAYVEIVRAREEAEATAVLVKRREETARSETEKFRVGKSTSLSVAQTQRDLLASQIQQAEAIVNCLQSFSDLYLSEGSLLERRGIEAPGREPVPAPSN